MILIPSLSLMTLYDLCNELDSNSSCKTILSMDSVFQDSNDEAQSTEQLPHHHFRLKFYYEDSLVM